MQEISGKIIAQKIIADCGNLPRPLGMLAAISVGDGQSSQNFLREKEKVAQMLGIDFKQYKLSSELSVNELRKEVARIAEQKSVSGIIVQLPLPREINASDVLSAIPLEKDVDVLGSQALGEYYSGRSKIIPPAVAALEDILKFINFDIVGKKVAVVGPGFLVGKPITLWLLGKAKNVFIVDVSGDFSVLKMADLIICGSGAAGIVKPEMLKDEAGVVDFGYGRDAAGKLVGDFAVNELTEKDRNRLAFYTPTPGGTGPVLVAELFKNFLTLASGSEV